MLRFVAFLLVLFCHFGSIHFAARYVAHPVGLFQNATLALVRSGGYGVDLFFTLSAFLITTLLLTEKDEDGSFSVSRFLIRRALRIWPLYFAFILVFSVIGVLGRLDAPQIVLQALFLQNWSWIFGITYPFLHIHLWSLCVEEQFYVSWPFLLKTAFRSMSLGMACAILFGVTTAAKAVCAAFGLPVWVNTFAHLDPIIAGIMFAHVVRTRQWSPTLKERIALFSTGSLCIPIVTYASYTSEYESWSFPAVAASCACLLGAVYGIKVAIPRWVILCGRMSYGLYMFHMPAIALGQILFAKGGLYGTFLALVPRPILIAPLVLAATFIPAYLSYRYFEMPFLRLKEKRFAAVRSAPNILPQAFEPR